eukprot:scaffold261742_cov31-Tisochrysis_lutea.AAC.4
MRSAAASGLKAPAAANASSSGTNTCGELINARVVLLDPIGAWGRRGRAGTAGGGRNALRQMGRLTRASH